MVIWTGHGWIGFVFMLVGLIGGDQLTDGILGEGYFEGHVWPKVAALLACAALCWIAGRWLNKDLPSRIVAVPRRPQDREDSAWATSGPVGHTLAFVRLEYAGLVAVPVYLFITLEQAGVL